MKDRRRTAVTFYGERDPTSTGPQRWVEIGSNGRTYYPTGASWGRLRQLSLRFVVYNGNFLDKVDATNRTARDLTACDRSFIAARLHHEPLQEPVILS